MKTWLTTTIVAVTFSTVSFSTAHASNEPMNIGQQGQMSIDTPRTGQSMDRVREKFGEPMRTNPAVGEPPITRWVYNGFTVYFEHDKVIHAVKHRS